jgi:hypothetical protein
MVFRLRVIAESIDSETRSFQARGATPDLAKDEAERIARDLEAGAVTRFYRGGAPQGRVVTARSTTDGLWLRVRIRSRDHDIWRLVESGAVNTVEVQPLEHGVDVFLKSVAATYPAETTVG